MKETVFYFSVNGCHNKMLLVNVFIQSVFSCSLNVVGSGERDGHYLLMIYTAEPRSHSPCNFSL